jgi:hypothetical protein
MAASTFDLANETRTTTYAFSRYAVRQQSHVGRLISKPKKHHRASENQHGCAHDKVSRSPAQCRDQVLYQGGQDNTGQANAGQGHAKSQTALTVKPVQHRARKRRGNRT